jgi:hypothetical protein
MMMDTRRPAHRTFRFRPLAVLRSSGLTATASLAACLAAGLLAGALALAGPSRAMAAEKVLVSGVVTVLSGQVYVRDDLGGDYLVAAPDLTLQKGKALTGRGLLEKKDNGEKVLTLTSYEIITPDAEECIVPDSLPPLDGGKSKDAKP